VGPTVVLDLILGHGQHDQLLAVESESGDRHEARRAGRRLR
jgi:hypothetical protein